MATLIYTGARVSELLGADIEDLGTDRFASTVRAARSRPWPSRPRPPDESTPA
jgi:integrase